MRFAAKEAVLKAIGAGLGRLPDARHRGRAGRVGRARRWSCTTPPPRWRPSTGSPAGTSASPTRRRWPRPSVIAVGRRRAGPTCVTRRRGRQPLASAGHAAGPDPRRDGARSTPAAPEPVEVLIGRAGGGRRPAQALDLLGGTYGRRVVVVAGKGNNGNDGREAARLPGAAGGCARSVIAVAEAPDTPARQRPRDRRRLRHRVPRRRTGHPTRPARPGARRRHPQRGRRADRRGRRAAPVEAVRTVTFAALKPGLLFHPGRALAGEVRARRHRPRRVAAPGVASSSAADVAAWVPPRPADAHKWQAAVVVVGRLARDDRRRPPGGPRRPAGRRRAWCAWRRRASTTTPACPPRPSASPLPAAGWDTVVLDQLDRAGALVIGPGLGRSAPTDAAVLQLVAVGAGAGRRRRRRAHRARRRSGREPWRAPGARPC